MKSFFISCIVIFGLFLGSAVVHAEPQNSSSAKGAIVKSKSKAEQAKARQALKVNVNSAKAQQIAETLKGIGLKKAEAIVNYRKTHGKFKNLEELSKVKGIGKSTIEKNRHRMTI